MEMQSWLAHLKVRIWQETEALRQANVMIMACLILGLVAQLAFFAAWQIEPIERPARRKETRGMSYLPEGPAGTGASAQSQSWLQDSEPLFFPTPWNTSASYREEQAANDPLFPEYPPILTLPQSATPQEWLNTPPRPDRLPWNNLARANYLGHSLLSQPPDPPLSADPSGTLRLQTFGNDPPLDFLRPTRELAGPREILWPKAVFSLQVRDRSLVGSPLLLESSQSATMDTALFAYLADPSVAAALPDGYYLATFSP